MTYPSREEALWAVLLPETQSKRDLKQLFERGYLAWQYDDELDREALIDSIEHFALEAIGPDSDDDDTFPPGEPIVDQPAVLAVVSTLGAITVLEHPELSDSPRHTLEPIADLRELYAETAQAFVYEGDTADLLQRLAEELYAKAPGEDGPHPGRVCTGVTKLDDEHYYVEIPLPAASPACVVRATEENLGGEYNAQTKQATGTVVSRLADNAVYVPVSHVLERHRETLREQFNTLLDTQEQVVTADQRSWLRTHATDIGDQIDRFLRTGHRELLWSDWNPDKRVVRVLRSALLETGLELDTGHTAAELYTALDRYDPAERWKADISTCFGNHRHLERELRDISAQDIGVEVEPMPEDVPDQFLVRPSGYSADDLQVDDIEDLFELPCFAAMDERLHEKGPVRKDLYNFARLVMWLPGYREMDLNELVEEFHDVFDRWPWYDPAETEYQIRYEFDNDIEGETPLPMGCSNPDMQRYCIGREECPYSIYGSLPFPEEMYDRLE